LKFLIEYFSIVIISATIPRFRVEQAIKFYWKWPLILSFVQVIIVDFVMGR
jgi:NADH-quinone oxidoreductase subunit H